MSNQFLTDTRTDAVLVGDLIPDERWVLQHANGNILTIDVIGLTLLATLDGRLIQSESHGPDSGKGHTATECGERNVAVLRADSNWTLTQGRPIPADPITAFMVMFG